MSRICRSLCYLILLVQVGFQIIICLQIISTQNKYMASIKSLTVGLSILQHILTKILELETMLQITRFIKSAPLVIKLRKPQIINHLKALIMSSHGKLHARLIYYTSFIDYAINLCERGILEHTDAVQFFFSSIISQSLSLSFFFSKTLTYLHVKTNSTWADI